MKGYIKKQAGRLKKWGKKRYLSGTAQENIAQVAKDVWYLKGLVNAEKHYHDISNISSTVTWSGTVIPLCGIAQGDTEQTRTGNSIFVRSINFKMIAYLRGSAPSDTLRVIVFMDNNAATGVAPVASDLLEYTGNQLASMSPLKFPEARNRFKILSNKVYSLNTARNPEMQIKYFKKLRHHVKYIGTTATDYGKGQLYVCIITDSNAGGTDDLGIRYQARVTFMDN